ncbi:MAG: DUF1704 domain-containing protein [Armatimonadetes bacterium]|nr:DUF1704 domain-containing protein [Armatimonadota bacterium]
MIPEERLLELLEQADQGQSVHYAFEKRGFLNLDRVLPFLCVYRGEDAATASLLSAEAAYLLLPPGRGRSASRLVRELAIFLRKSFGRGAVLELWSGPPSRNPSPAPRFVVHTGRHPDDRQLAEVLVERLERIKTKPRVDLEIGRPHPADLPPLLSAATAEDLGCLVLGLEVEPMYLEPVSGEPYPMLLRNFRRNLGRALRQTFFEFTQRYTQHRPAHYHSLGQRALVRAVWEVDRRLEEIASSFSFLLQVTPVNAHEAWLAFRRSGFQQEPRFIYRPFPQDPILLRRELHKIPIEKVEDPTLAQLFLDKHAQLDVKIAMLSNRNRRDFLYGSFQLYGEVEPWLSRLARRLLSVLERGSQKPPAARMDAQDFAREARREVARYRQKYDGFLAEVEVREDLGPSILADEGHLFIGAQASVAEDQLMPLLHHEVGTHLVTYYNGQAQPLRLMKLGMPGYLEFQEGLAVLAEHLTGGLNRDRLRILAARVLAVEAITRGAGFLETFERLRRACSLPARLLFWTTMRACRGGGFTKDAAYLRGLVDVLDHLSAGGELEPLYVGKFGRQHLPLVRELRSRGVVCDPPLLPRFLRQKEAQQRLRRLRQGGPVEVLLGLASTRS